MEIKFNSGEELPLNKMIKIHNATIVFRSVFHENNKCHPRSFFFRWTLKWIINNKKILYYDRIDVFEGIDVNKTS